MTTSPSRWAPLPVLMAATFMVVLDFFIVAVALPSMQAGLGASAGAIEWVVAGYGLSLAVLLITAGRLGDRHGRRRLFAWGLALFTLASAACGAAPSAELLVVARILQGLAAALLTPQVLSIIGVSYGAEDRVRALAVYGMVMGVAAAGGQLLGGVLIQADLLGLGWRTCFLINVPVGAVALALTPRVVPESRAERPGGADPLGAALLTAGLTAIVLPLVEGRQHGWPAWTWLSLAAAPLLLGAFALHSRRLAAHGRSPVLLPALFRARSFTAGLTTQQLFWCGQASFFVFLALYLQQGRGLTPLDAGLLFTVAAVAYVVASARAPELVGRHGRRLVGAGAIVLGAGHALALAAVLEIGMTGSVLALAPGLALVGAGMGLCMTPLVSVVMSGVDPEHSGAASGTLSTIQQVGNALGVALIGVLFFGTAAHGLDEAFAACEAVLVAVSLGVAGLTRLLPAHG
jgi:EmrB/QacA subfamily drug resistance transporter